MSNLSKKLKRFLILTLLVTFPLTSTSTLATELLIANNTEDVLEVIRKRRINKKNNLVVKFCSKLKDYTGYVLVDGKKFLVSDADIKKPRKIVWKDVNLTKSDSDKIDTSNLKARYIDEDITEDLKFLDDGECGVGLFPLILIGAGIAVGAGSGGSGTTSSN
tara:strand:- start:204 stop:689 length:486 start_codon:yes stop_codon:yes gene_type:complete